MGCGVNEEDKIEQNTKEKGEVVKLSIESMKQINLETETASLQPFIGYLTIPAKVITNQDNEARIGSIVQGGENIKLARLRRKLITQQVANRAEISRKTLYAPTIGKPENIHKQTMNGASKQAQC